MPQLVAGDVLFLEAVIQSQSRRTRTTQSHQQLDQFWTQTIFIAVDRL